MTDAPVQQTTDAAGQSERFQPGKQDSEGSFSETGRLPKTTVIPGLAEACDAAQRVTDELELDLQPTEVFDLAKAAVCAASRDAEIERLREQVNTWRAFIEARGTNRDYWEGRAKVAEAENAKLRMALGEAVATIEDYLAYQHDGDPWREDARTMGEMDINDYAIDGRLARAKEALANVR